MEHTNGHTDPQGPERDHFTRSWHRLRDHLKARWGKLTDEDLDRVSGHMDRLVRVIEEKYHYASQVAQRQVQNLMREYEELRGHRDHTTKRAGEESAGERPEPYATTAKTKMSERATEATTAAGGKMRSLAGVLREKVPREGNLGSTATAAADRLDAAGAYLQEKNVEQIGKDLGDFIRRHPARSVFISLGLGYLFARRSSRRKD